MSIETKPTFFTRRVQIALVSLLLAALLLYIFLPRNAGAYRAVPAQTSFLLECKGLLRAKILCDKTPDTHWREVLHSPIFSRCFDDTEAAVQLLKHEPSLVRAFAKNKALAAFSLHPADSLHALFVLELDADFNLEKALKTNQLTPKYFPHQFHGNDIFNVHLSKTERLEVAKSGRLLFFSRRATLIEDALAQLENARNWWADRPYLADLPEATLRFQLRPAALAEQCRSQMNPHWRGLPDLLARNIEWAGLSWDGSELQSLVETKGFLGSLGAWGQGATENASNVLPDNTAFVASTALGNIPDFFEGIGGGRNSDFDQYILPWVGEEAVFAITEPLSPALMGDRLLLLSVRDSARALGSLRAFGKERGALPGGSGPYQMFELLGFQSASLLHPILGDDEAFRNPVCALVGGYVVFAPDRSSLEIFLDKYLVNQTLATNVDFLQLQQKSKGKSHAAFLLNAAYLPSLLQNLAIVEKNNGIDRLSKTGYISAELEPGFGRKAVLTFANQTLSQPISETDILWKTVLATPIIDQPYLVEQAEGKTYALVQDLKNNLYCLDAQNGAQVWQKGISERITTSIRGVDFYGNGSQCYTFGTATRLFMLDENGRDVQGFPFELPDKATNGATVVDFDKNSKFSFFVACENGKVYGFGHLGKPLDGWSGLQVSGTVQQPILHFQHKGKDYLAVLTQLGWLSVFGRDGNLRFPPVQLDEMPPEANFDGGVFIYPLFVDVRSSSPRIYCGNPTGKVFSCDLQGKVSEQRPGRPASMATFGQLLGDERFEYAVLEGKDLMVGNWGKTLFKTQFPEKQQHVFFTSKQRIGTVDKKGRRIWLLDNRGKTMPGFPLGGNTAFEFGSLNGVEMLVVGNGNGVWAYRVRL